MKTSAIALVTVMLACGAAHADNGEAGHSQQQPQGNGGGTCQIGRTTTSNTGQANADNATPGNTAKNGWQGGGGGSFSGTSGHESADGSSDQPEVAKGLDPVLWVKTGKC